MAVIFAVSLIALVAVAALVVDAGNAVMTRRRLVTASDAGALAAANSYADGGSGCDVAAGIATSNFPSARPGACRPEQPASPHGSVTLTVDYTLSYALAPVIGFDNVDLSSTTTASFSRTGLRPYGICVQALGQAVVTVTHDPLLPGPCSGTPDPGTPDPGTPDPGTPDPGTPDPGTPDPGAATPDFSGGTLALLDFNQPSLAGGSTCDPLLTPTQVSQWIRLGAFPARPDLANQPAWCARASAGEATRAALGDLQNSKIPFLVPVVGPPQPAGAGVAYVVSEFALVQLLGHSVAGGGTETTVSLTLQILDRKAVVEPDDHKRIRICAIDDPSPARTCAYSP